MRFQNQGLKTGSFAVTHGRTPIVNIYFYLILISFNITLCNSIEYSTVKYSKIKYNMFRNIHHYFCNWKRWWPLRRQDGSLFGKLWSNLPSALTEIAATLQTRKDTRTDQWTGSRLRDVWRDQASAAAIHQYFISLLWHWWPNSSMVFYKKKLPFLRMGIPKSPLVSIQSHGLKSNDLGVILGVPPWLWKPPYSNFYTFNRGTFLVIPNGFIRMEDGLGW